MNSGLPCRQCRQPRAGRKRFGSLAQNRWATPWLMQLPTTFGNGRIAKETQRLPLPLDSLSIKAAWSGLWSRSFEVRDSSQTSQDLDRCDQSRQLISQPITLLFRAKNTSKELASLAGSSVLLTRAPESPKRGLFKDRIHFFSGCREILATLYSFHLLRFKKTLCPTHSMPFFSTNNTRNFIAQRPP